MTDTDRSLLMHFCCGPCGVGCVSALREEGLDFTGYWFNPNIHPYTEHRSRRDGLKMLSEIENFNVIWRDEYGLREFVKNVADDIENRCFYCYSVRMDAVAKAAKENGFKAFTTTLLTSPYQNHEGIIEAAKAAADKYEVEFLYRDFRPFFRDGQTRAREMGLYIQKYCGCIFSEEERYSKAWKKQQKLKKLAEQQNAAE